jgi:hypothetical protein
MVAGHSHRADQALGLAGVAPPTALSDGQQGVAVAVDLQYQGWESLTPSLRDPNG